MTEMIFLVEEALEGGYIARALGESIFTEAETMEELKTNIREAVDCYFDDTDTNKPKLIRLHLVKEELITL
jgi:predicted RNase H-like HicB family nuclease